LLNKDWRQHKKFFHVFRYDMLDRQDEHGNRKQAHKKLQLHRSQMKQQKLM